MATSQDLKWNYFYEDDCFFSKEVQQLSQIPVSARWTCVKVQCDPSEGAYCCTGEKIEKSIPEREVADSIFRTDHKILQNISDEQI